ncbi:Ppx/GppA phosphatase family protein [Lipingzhangella sp. LS1_29]|uniref:Ppx/GppA phosphatase family protein n=1 Tax=Lipingzhangella rawalii TaxID=2055835 RepID=A0ABU2HA54_9ACTN|nr:Ppx/GppA phosphatase family protein [Lipingzhangella rawalii]MDS1272166.1 Ppx/GppA phosphatase family protein [Lipingzhangella rawalii]
MSETVAAIDCGTNSLRLLIAHIAEASAEAPDEGELALVDLERRMEVVRLGQDVDRTGQFAPEALERTFAALDGYAKLLSANGVEAGPETVRMVATSASRDVSNRDEFVSGVRSILGVEPEVISGDDEAELSFVGATAELTDGDSDGQAAPFLVVDIGGGSTEFVLGHGAAGAEERDSEAGVVRAARSVDIGCVRLTERHLRDDPPTAEQIAAARADVDAALDEVERTVPLSEAATLVCVAGTATTVAGIAEELPAYDPERIHLSRVSAGEVRDVTEKLVRMPRDERAAIPVMHPGRVDVIGAGALILDRVVQRVGAAEFVASEHDILDGIVWQLALGQ